MSSDKKEITSTKIKSIAFEYFIGEVLRCSPKQTEQILQSVEYGDPTDVSSQAKIVIVASDFFDEGVFGTLDSILDNPVEYSHDSLGEIPLIFGTPKIEEDNYGRKIIYADLIASSFFLLTRYEESIKKEVRDIHGRFPGIKSLPWRRRFLQMPVVDIYRKWFCELLREININVNEDADNFSLVLTHDIDSPFRFLYAKKTLGLATLQAIGKRQGNPVHSIQSWLGTREDPYDTFDWMNKRFQDAVEKLGKRVRQIYFVMACDNGPFDSGYTVENKRVRKLLKRLKESGAEFGLHPSYKAGTDPDEIIKEKRRLESVLEIPITKTRHHYLRLREPEHTRWLIDAGFTDDYSAGYADVAGFRNGTSRPFQYFDLEKQRSTDFCIHPLPIMECTFSDPRYMNLDLEASIKTACQIADQSIKCNGELCLLWHNPTFAHGSGEYHKTFYQRILNYIYQQLA